MTSKVSPQMVATLFMIFLVISILLNSYLVKISYNIVGPKLMGNRYKSITFMESLALIILFSILFKCSTIKLDTSSLQNLK